MSRDLFSKLLRVGRCTYLATVWPHWRRFVAASRNDDSRLVRHFTCSKIRCTHDKFTCLLRMYSNPYLSGICWSKCPLILIRVVRKWRWSAWVVDQRDADATILDPTCFWLQRTNTKHLCHVYSNCENYMWIKGSLICDCAQLCGLDLGRPIVKKNRDIQCSIKPESPQYAIVLFQWII